MSKSSDYNSTKECTFRRSELNWLWDLNVKIEQKDQWTTLDFKVWST